MPVAIIEIVVVFALTAAAILMQKDVRVTEYFLHWSAFMITFGGTLAASILQL